MKKIGAYLIVLTLILTLSLSAAVAQSKTISIFKLDGKTPQDSIVAYEQGTRLTYSFMVQLSPAPTSGSTVTLRVTTAGTAPLSVTAGSTLQFNSKNSPQKVSVKEGDVKSGQTATVNFTATGGYGTATVNYSVGTITTTGTTTGGGGATTPTDSGTAGFSKSLVQNLADPTGFVYISWRVVRGAINVLLIIALLAISFSNILRINIDTYTVKKALPNLVIGVILANASFLIVKYMTDIATTATYFFVNLNYSGSQHFTTFNDFFAGALKLLGITTINSTFFGAGPLLAIIFVIIAIVLILWLAFLLYFRLVAIYLLTILAPLAFVAYGIPGFEKYFKQWWQQFVKWLFILVAISAVFWLMLVIGGASQGNNSIASLLIMYVLFFMALTLPSKMGGAVIQKADQFLRKNPLSKGVSDYASTKGQQIGYRLPGVARFQAWKEMNAANAKKDIELLKKGGKAKMMGGVVGRYTARNAAKLDFLDKEIAANEAAAQALQSVEADKKFNLAERVNAAEFRKKLEEERKGAHENEAKLDYLLSPDEKVKDLLKKVNTAIIDNEVLTKEVGRQEGIEKGNQASEYLQPLQAAQNWKRLNDEFGTLNDQNDAGGARRTELTAKMAEIEKSFDGMKGKPAYSDQFGKLSVKQLAFQLDGKDENGNDLTDGELKKQGRILMGRQRQTAVMFNAGIAGQIESQVKEQTVAELEQELKAYLAKEMGGDSEKIQAFFNGDTAKLSSLGASTNDVRNGLVIAEKFKTILRSTNDIRHGDALATFAKYQQENTGDLGIDVNTVAHQGVKERREAAAELTQKSGILARQANIRNQNAVPTSTTPSRLNRGQPAQSRQNTVSQADLDYAADNLGGGFGQAPSATSAPPATTPPDEEEVDDEGGGAV